jgi:hypothetical protein
MPVPRAPIHCPYKQCNSTAQHSTAQSQHVTGYPGTLMRTRLSSLLIHRSYFASGSSSLREYLGRHRPSRVKLACLEALPEHREKQGAASHRQCATRARRVGEGRPIVLNTTAVRPAVPGPVRSVQAGWLRGPCDRGDSPLSCGASASCWLRRHPSDGFKPPALPQLHTHRAAARYLPGRGPPGRCGSRRCERRAAEHGCAARKTQHSAEDAPAAGPASGHWARSKSE